MVLVHSATLGAFFSLPLDSLLSTQGIMVMLLAAYAGAMWMFLTSAPQSPHHYGVRYGNR